MSKLFSRNVLAVLALAFPVAALADITNQMVTLTQAGQIVSLDTGTTVNSGGDLLWDGTNLIPQGSMFVYVLSAQGSGAMAAYLRFTTVEIDLDFMNCGGSQSSVPGTVNQLFMAITNGEHDAKVLVTAQSGTSITIEFTTYTSTTNTSCAGKGTGGNAPVVNALVNNYSNIPPGLPSYGIAPGSLFVIYGTGMSDPGNPVLHSFKDGPLPTTLNHTSISVTVNGITTNPGMYYTSPGQIAAVLPSSTPAGQGTITVTYNGTPSAPAPIVVTASAFGADTLPGSVNEVTATDASYHLITPTASASPGQTIVIWGSGLGADTRNDDRTYPLNQDNLNDATVYIGGVKANVRYAGRSQFPGVDQIDVDIPELGAALQAASLPGQAVAHASSGFQGGCGISVAVVAHNIVSNFVTVPVNPGGGVCSDPAFGTTGTSGSSSGTRRDGFVKVSRATVPSSDLGSDRSDSKPRAQATTTLNNASASFTSTTGSSSAGTRVSLGNCIVYYPGELTGNETVTYLDAGASIGLSGGGIATQIPVTPGQVGSYNLVLNTALTAGTSYTFKGTGGKDVGSFTVSVTFPTLLDWTNENSITTVTESQGQPITWTGGEPGTYIFIGGTSSTSGEPSVNMTFFCYVPVEDQQFTIPSYVLLTLPKGNGTLGMSNSAVPVAFPTTTGLDYASAQASDTIDINVTYQ